MEEMHRQALGLNTTVLGKEYSSTPISMNNLAIVSSYQGKYKQAEEIHQQVLGLMVPVLREEHPNALTSMNNSCLNSMESRLVDRGRATRD